MLIVWMKSFVL